MTKNKLNRHKSDKNMTPKLTKVRSKGQGMFEHLRRSKVSEVELKEEVIRDLTGKKHKGSKKRIIRQ